MNSFAPRTIIIDEPQSFLHPGAIRKLFNILDKYKQHQYILATHSTTVINSAKESKLIFIEKNNNESNFEELNTEETKNIRKVLSLLGVNISDIFGADNILWVEGPTEESLFPKLLSTSVHPGTQICAVKNTGDFDGKKAMLVFDIYAKISGGNRLVPPAICFIFDSEFKNEKDKEDISRRSSVPVYWLERVMVENYLIDADAIAVILNKIRISYEISSETINSESVQNWIINNFNNKKYYPSVFQKDSEQYQIEDDMWLIKIHGASFLEDLFHLYFEEKYTFQKTYDSVNIANWLIENDRESIARLKTEIINFLNTVK
jgi:hypothetical protein